MLREAKLAICEAALAFRLTKLALNSNWRQRCLLILCYHGVSQEDEHEWNGSLYMHRNLFRQRLETLSRLGCNVLPLSEAIERLSAGTLPPRSVAITVDDGSYDFYSVAWPILREFGYPATVYFTTYYSDYNRPVFDTMCSYLLWKARGRRLEWPRVLPQAEVLNSSGQSRVAAALRQYAVKYALSGRAKDMLLGELATQLGVNYEALCRKRLLHLMTPQEARELAAAGVDLQLHTHRHRVARNRDRLYRELDENKTRVMAATDRSPAHFCYTGGLYFPEFPAWLRDYGLRSATTCDVGLARKDTDPMLLPRLVDTSTLSATEFETWVSGIADLLPHRRLPLNMSQLADDEVKPATAMAAAGASR